MINSEPAMLRSDAHNLVDHVQTVEGDLSLFKLVLHNFNQLLVLRRFQIDVLIWLRVALDLGLLEFLIILDSLFHL